MTYSGTFSWKGRLLRLPEVIIFNSCFFIFYPSILPTCFSSSGAFSVLYLLDFLTRLPGSALETRSKFWIFNNVRTELRLLILKVTKMPEAG